MTLEGRLKLATRVGEYQHARFDRTKGQCDLVYKKGIFYLIVTVDAPEKSEYDPIGKLGVDLGIENLAVDSDREVFESKQVEQKRRYYSNRRSILQRVGTRSAKRRLQKISGKERRFKKDTNHTISKAIVSKAKGTNRAIILEDLTDIRSKATVKKDQRDKHSKWTFRFITYKSKSEGVLLKIVEPINTSRECPKCHHIDKRNRKSQNEFKCQNCGYEDMAVNIM